MNQRAGLPRWLEVPIACSALIVLLPLMAVASLAIFIESGWPVLFTQVRVGRNRSPLRFVKLRSMTAGVGGSLLTAAGDSRVTRCGRVLRRAKLDELPTLWHVVTGDMSLVGPRPETPNFVDAGPVWDEVLSARPGITDPVTVALRHEEAYLQTRGGDDPERFYRERLLPLKLKGYVHYLRRRTWLTDITVLASTLVALLHLTPSSQEIDPDETLTVKDL